MGCRRKADGENSIIVMEVETEHSHIIFVVKIYFVKLILNFSVLNLLIVELFTETKQLTNQRNNGAE